MAITSILSRLIGEYEFYRILWVDRTIASSPTERDTGCRRLEDPGSLSSSRHPELAQLVNYAGEESICFIKEERGEIVAACWYWFGETYQQRNFWPLKPREAKLVQITTAPETRGRGAATSLIRYSAAQMLESGFNALYARVWHSHVASLKAFEKAGWVDHARVIEAKPLGRRTRLQWWV